MISYDRGQKDRIVTMKTEHIRGRLVKLTNDTGYSGSNLHCCGFFARDAPDICYQPGRDVIARDPGVTYVKKTYINAKYMIKYITGNIKFQNDDYLQFILI